MKNNFLFTFKKLEEHYKVALENGYEFLTCNDYLLRKSNLSPLTIVNRVDIDISVSKAQRLMDIFNLLAIKATFFVRLHAKEYNPFSFENYKILKAIRDSGHEIGYHSEIVDQAAIWNEDASDCLNRDVDIMNRIFEIKIKGIASHGGLTGLNNLDFWKERDPREFGLLYEAYDKSESFDLFNSSFYISDSEWTRWKCYDHGTLVENDSRDLTEHIKNKYPLIYLLIHSDTYYDRHIYE
jgi:hypothetical protein